MADAEKSGNLNCVPFDSLWYLYRYSQRSCIIPLSRHLWSRVSSNRVLVHPNLHWFSLFLHNDNCDIRSVVNYRRTSPSRVNRNLFSCLVSRMSSVNFCMRISARTVCLNLLRTKPASSKASPHRTRIRSLTFADGREIHAMPNKAWHVCGRPRDGERAVPVCAQCLHTGHSYSLPAHPRACRSGSLTLWRVIGLSDARTPSAFQYSATRS